MSDNNAAIYGTPQVVSLPTGDVALGSYIVNDYLITVTADTSGNGYLLTIRKGSQEQTIHLTELTQEAVNAAISASLTQAKESGEFDGNGIESVVFNPDYTLSLYFTDGTSVTTGSIRGKEGNGIQGITMNPDYTLSITFTNGDIYTTDPIRGETGKGISRIALNQDYTLTITYTDGTSTTTGSIRGSKGDTGNGISGVIFNDDYTLTINFTDGTSYRTESIRGLKGDTGTGVRSTVLNQDYTLTINLDDGTSYTTPSIRGQKGDKGDKGDPGDSFELHICSSVEYDHETRIPTVPYPRRNVLYLVPSEEGFETDLFVEWAYINNSWEKFGSASMNLDAYAKKTELDEKLNKPANDGLQGQVLTSDGSGGQTWSNSTTPDWNAASGTSGFIKNKLDLKAGTGTDSITNRHSLVSGNHSMATGTNNIVSGADNYVTGTGNNAKGTATFMAGTYNTAEVRGSNSLVGGNGNSVSNGNAIVAGSNNTVSGVNSAATGNGNTVSGSNSSVRGENVIANHKSQTVSGEYNVSDPSAAAATARGNYVEIVGNGTSTSARSNARTLDWSGNEWLAGNLKIGGTGYDDVNAKEVETAVLASAPLSEPASIVTIENGEEDMPVKELTFGIESIQEGSGDPSPENIRPITGYTGAEIVKTGKNFLDRTKEAQNYRLNNTGGLSSNSSYSTSDYISVLPGMTLHFKNLIPSGLGYSLWQYGVDKNPRGYVNLGTGSSPVSGSATMWANTRYIRVSYWKDTTNREPSVLYETTDNEPFVTNDVILITFPVEAGTVYGGYVEIKDGEAKLVVTHKLVTLDGSEDDWNYGSGNYPGFRHLLSDGKIDGVPSQQLMSNWLVGTEGRGNRGSGNPNSIYTYSGTTGYDAKYIFVCNVGTNDLTAFKAMLASNPLQIRYPLATPVTYTLDSVTLTTIQGLNHIWANTGDISSLTYITNPGIYELITGTVKSKEDVKDVQVNGTSVVNNGIANISVVTTEATIQVVGTGIIIS